MAASLRNSDEITKFATQDLTTNQYRFVILDSASTVDLVTSIYDNALGVQTSKNQSTIGKEVSVKVVGEMFVEAAAAIPINSEVAPSTNGRGQVAVSGQQVKGICRYAAAAAGDLCVIELMTNAALLSHYAQGAVSAEVAFRFGKTITEGLELKIIEEDVVMDGSASNALTNNPLIGSVIISVQANLETTITATTAVEVGVGTLVGGDDPNLYSSTADLVKNSKIDTMVAFTVLAAEEELAVFACDVNGAAAGTLDTGTVRVRIIYFEHNSLDDAA
jgi:hypothetical protein